MTKEFIVGFDIGTSSGTLFGEDTDGNPYGPIVVPQGYQWISDEPTQGAFMQDPVVALRAVNEGLKRFCQEYGVSPEQIIGIGGGGRMHSVIATNRYNQLVARELMWNFSASDDIRQKAMEHKSLEKQQEMVLGAVGNFWGPKIRWAYENLPHFADTAERMHLIGGFIGAQLTGEWAMPRSGASETLLFNPNKNQWETELLEYFEIRPEIMPHTIDNLAVLGKVTKDAARLDTILREGTPFVHVGGDQALAALGFNVSKPGEADIVGGSSGVIYAVSADPLVEKRSRINTFVHSVPAVDGKNVYGLLACLNAAGQFYQKLKEELHLSGYDDMNRLAARVGFGADGLAVAPYVFGTERLFENRTTPEIIWDGYVDGRHGSGHKCRAALEAVATWYTYAAKLMGGMGAPIEKVKVSKEGLFLNDSLCEWVATLLNVEVERYVSTGARGAVKGARVAILGESLADAYKGFTPEETFSPNAEINGPLQEVYQRNLQLLRGLDLIS